MIKVSSIWPIDRSSAYQSIADLEQDYLARLRTGTNIETLLRNALESGYSRTYRLRQRDLPILRYLEDNFARIVLSEPTELHELILHFQQRGWQRRIYDGTNTTAFGKEIQHIFGYSQRFRNRMDRGIWLAQQLNIKSCPYCNAQSTIVVADHRNRMIAKFQFDHFFPKDRYPFLSVSLYNLIPSCPYCNLTKSNRTLNLKDHYHPYFIDFSLYFSFHLKYSPSPRSLTISRVKELNLQIELKPNYPASRSFIEAHNELYHLNGVYNRHQDIAEELLTKAVVYTNHLIESHLKIEGLFPDRPTYIRYLIGTYPNSEEILRRPLTKFIQDIAKQLKLY